MHALSHSLAHRATPATRTRVRWQPYSSTSNSSMTTSLPSPSSTSFNTPSTEATSSPSLSFSRELNRSSSKPHLTKEISSRELSKNKFALGLVDQAISSLSEIWKPQDIPTVFLTGPKSTLDYPTGHKLLVHQSNPQLLCAPNTSPPTAKDIQTSSFKNKLVPIKGFVHEVLRRSRTSGHVLQTALCYIEALRPKVPELIRKEKAGEFWKEPASVDLIEVLADAELWQHAEVQRPHSNHTTDQSDPTTRPPSTPNESCEQGRAGMSAAVDSKLSRSDTLPLLVELPSPLLCPRRSFLAALILASKFTQDKCYSNRAWAKLSGLTPREISRCERALGEALEWRLWVGKLPVVPQPAPPPPRALHRSRSESCLKSRPLEPFLPLDERQITATTTDRSLRRCSTLPAEAFGSEQKTDDAVSDITMSDSRAVMLETTASALPQWPTTFPYQTAAEDSPDSQSSTPPLVYSPTSSDSSSGADKTVQGSFQETPGNDSQIHNILPLLSLPTPGIVTKGASAMQDFVVKAPSIFLPAIIIEEGIRYTWRLEEQAIAA